ncbi:hypothetical protein NPIL_122601 [Nephila pilipes]|uniref:Uncharacterized protein n=1 Tax=Nephila pilipes TaxID=299642 RepID=A0A8X6U878_NEPPI|nr:hypothetical protein NPIL_122601 [Nephila pilipes]
MNHGFALLNLSAVSALGTSVRGKAVFWPKVRVEGGKEGQKYHSKTPPYPLISHPNLRRHRDLTRIQGKVGKIGSKRRRDFPTGIPERNPYQTRETLRTVLKLVSEGKVAKNKNEISWNTRIQEDEAKERKNLVRDNLG